MSIKDHVKSIQHIGVPTKDIEKTVEFYENLGFEKVYEKTKDSKHTAFMKLGDAMIEVYASEIDTMMFGSVDHIALNVDDIEAINKEVTELGYEALEGGIITLPFWKNGSKFFSIAGPNNEKIEFNQIL